MKRKFIYFLVTMVIVSVLPACTPKMGSHRVAVTKPKFHLFPYNHRKHKKRKTTKTVIYRTKKKRN